MTKYRIMGIIGVILLILLALVMVPNKVGATAGCDWYLQHTPSPDHPDGWGECMWNTPTPTDEVTATPTETDEPSITPTTDSPTPVSTEDTATPTATDSTTVPQTATPPAATPTPTKVTCKTKCVYNLSGKPGTHAVTAVSPNAEGPYTWQVEIKGVWYDVYDCNGQLVETNAEARGETSITRLIVDSSTPTDASAYRITGGAAAILFDDFSY